MHAYRTATTVSEDGKVTVSNLPFRSGQAVEVVVRPRQRWASEQNPYPLRGTAYSYADPTEPINYSGFQAGS